ncbi:MAG: tetratricopeptide repeat protein [Opitutales bacterium]
MLSCSLSAQPSGLTLQETLAQGQAAVAAGDYQGAYAAFQTIETTFAREPEVAADSFKLVVWPVHGYVALLTGRADEARRLFEAFIERFPEDRTRLDFVLFNLARAQSEVNRAGDAIETYRRFVALDPDRAEASLATLEAVRLMFENDRTDEAFATLETLQVRLAPGLLRTKARLTALQEALKLGRIEQARRLMLEDPWEITEMPELAVLAFAALQMGNELLAARSYADAIRCYRLVPPYPMLLAAQAARLHETRARFEDRRQSVGLYQGGQFWTQYYTRLISRLEAQLKGLREAEDYSAALYLSLGQAYLLDERSHEAWIIFERLARDASLSEARQAEAHYRWILAAIGVGVWEDAFRIAEGFGQRFPESPLVPDALYLLATAYQQAGQYREAIQVFDRFLVKHSEHTLAPRVLFVRGYSHNLLNQPVEARADFDRFIARHKEHGLYWDARFWRCLTFFAERDYAATLEGLRTLAPEVEKHRLEPEVAYRIAATLYAMRDYEAALAEIQTYLSRYPQHARADEGRVLLGDIQMGRGELTEARTIFSRIDPSAGHLFAYAVFQVGKILRAVAGAEDTPAERRRELLNRHREHFEGYLAREDVPEKTRISEALYWIGWTDLEQGEPESARAVFRAALEKYGDALEAGQVPNIIAAYARIEKELSGLGRREQAAALRSWIQAEKERALPAGRLTYFARLNFYLESMETSEEPTGHIFEIVEKVPIERLDSEGLGRIAARLARDYPLVAEDYLIRLEEEHPDSPHRSYGYFARGLLHLAADQPERAEARLARFRAESPLHPLATEANLLYGQALTRTGNYEEAHEVLESILQLRTAKGRPHARALLGLSHNAEAAGEIKRAVPYAQRVFNSYRAYPELAAEAYLLSARQFEALGDALAAYRTLEEMLKDERLAALPLAEEAEAKRRALRQQLPGDVLAPSPTPASEMSNNKAKEVLP